MFYLRADRLEFGPDQSSGYRRPEGVDVGEMNVPLIRQIARLYDAVLLTGNSLATLANSLPGTVEEIKRLTASNNQELAQVIAEAAKTPKKDIDIYDRFDLRLLLERSCLVDRSIIDSGTWEHDQTTFFMGLMEKLTGKKNGVFLDIGAYWGLYSLLAMRAGVQTIYAFEPDRHNFAQLQAQMFLNGACGYVQAINKAVSNSTRIMRFCDSRAHPSRNRAGVGVVSEDFAWPAYNVEAVSIDEYLNLERCTIGIKVDVEGHEYEVLCGMAETLKRNKVFMQVEVFEVNAKRTLPAIEALGVREIKQIYPDRYYTNMAVEELGA